MADLEGSGEEGEVLLQVQWETTGIFWAGQWLNLMMVLDFSEQADGTDVG